MTPSALLWRWPAGARLARFWTVLMPVLVLALLAGGCATVPAGQRARSDPFEGFNRSVFAVNEALDTAVVRPAAELYQKVVPHWLRSGIDNMYGNLGDVWSGVNLLLQGKGRKALETGVRVGMNSLFGLGGFFDVADEAGLPRNGSEDFGQTLGVWGFGPGPYLVLPLLGPSNIRDGLALTLDASGGGVGLVLKDPSDRNAATVLQLLQTRVRLLGAGQFLDDIALDKYLLLRDAYLARRRSLVYDGEPPEDEPPPEPATAPPNRRIQ